MRTWLLLILTLVTHALSAQAQYLFNKLSSSDGLSSKNIFCSYQDSLGFMWFGAPNGLNRYDGSGFKVITPYTKSFLGLPNEEVHALIEHGHGRLWVGTSGGLCYLDRGQSAFTLVPLIRGADTLRQLNIIKLIKDRRQRLWVATANGLFVLHNGAMLAASALYPSASYLDTFAGSAYEAGRFTDAFYLRGDKELLYFNYSTGEVFSRANNPAKWRILDAQEYFIIAVAADGRVWYSREGDGLGWFDPRTNTEFNFPAWKDRPVYKMAFDSRGRLWFCDRTHRAFVMQPDGTISEIVSKPGDPFRISYPYFHHVYEDRIGNIWFATLNGVSKLSGRPVLQSVLTLPSSVPDPLPKSLLINALVPADSQHLWICRHNGILLLNASTLSVQTFKPPPGIGANSFFDAKKVHGEWWCATGDGIYKLNLLTHSLTRLAIQPEGCDSEGRAAIWIQQDRSGTVWAATWNETIYRFSPEGKKWIRTTGRLYGDTGRINSHFGFVDNGGKLWASYGAEGIRHFDWQRNRWVNPPMTQGDSTLVSRLTCYAMVEDAHGDKWIATNRRGVIKLDAKGRVVDSISLRDGLHSNYAGGLWLQPNGRLWISTLEGLQHTLLERKQLSGFALTGGISVINYNFPLLQMGEKLYVGLNDKLAVIDLEVLAASQAASPAPLITSVQVLGEEASPPVNGEELRLSHRQNFFSITFSSPLHNEMPSMHYAYMLKGFDKGWVNAGRNQLASYTAVPPGRYRFLVRTTNADGEWSANVTEIRLRIMPPFWMRWWGILLEIALLAALGFGIYRNVLRRRRNRRIESAVSYFANSVYGHNSVNEICWDISRNCMAQMGLEDCVVYLRDSHRPVLVQTAAYGPKNTFGFAINNPIEIAIGEGIVGSVAASAKALLVADTAKDPRYVIDDRSRASELAVPIVHDGEVIGVIDTEHSEKGFYTPAHLKAFTTIASITSTKIAEAKAEAEVQEKAVQLLEIQKLLAESQLMALRAQMNPHFVFNCLNSIQECIVTAKYGEASQYLNKFSKLFRMLLSNSGRGMISLAEEIEVLELYLSLEHMRFERSFQYDIIVDEDLEIAEILIPSMLLQPFVENALWHGLMHKEADRELLIKFESISEDLFRCTIDDNGIGRDAARKLKAAKTSGSKHQSMGMQITADRIELMQRQGQAASIQILDKKTADGLVTGTTIIIELSSYLTTNTS